MRRRLTGPHSSPAAQDDFLALPNRHGVSPMLYLKSLHGQEFLNLLERLGARDEAEAWAARADALGGAVSGEVELRLWASCRGQTLARTVRGLMQSARAVRLLATLQLELEYAAVEERRAARRAALEAADPAAAAALPPLAPPRGAEAIEADAAHAAVWFAAERFSYLLAAQRYSDHLEDDVRRRADIDLLMLVHPLLSVAHFESSVSPFSGRRRLLCVCRSAAQGVRFRLPLAGNAIVDGIGEGKPENANCAAPFVLGRVVQAIDMNQDFYLEEALKLPNALLTLSTSTRAVAASGRPVVVVGLREHIFTQVLSAPAYFMSQQEYLFGVMWQRIMASPLDVRMHYGRVAAGACTCAHARARGEARAEARAQARTQARK